MSTREFVVTGMTCGHCVASIEEEVGALAGVSDVRVDLASGRMTVTSTTALTVDAVTGAVETAGYAARPA